MRVHVVQNGRVLYQATDSRDVSQRRPLPPPRCSQGEPGAWPPPGAKWAWEDGELVVERPYLDPIEGWTTLERVLQEHGTTLPRVREWAHAGLVYVAALPASPSRWFRVLFRGTTPERGA